MGVSHAPRIAIDAMGGDGGPSVTVAGAALALSRNPSLQFRLVGNEQAIRAELAHHAELARVTTVVHADDVISGEDKPAQAIRRAKTTSMGIAIASVKDGCGRFWWQYRRAHGDVQTRAADDVRH
jgi:glycerol-3-phosphate acyltransferase PlsX